MMFSQRETASRESSHVIFMSIELLENEQYLGVSPVTESEDAKFRERKFTVYGLKWDFSHLMGEILTIVDASITDPVQRKAIKDMVKSRFRSKLENIKAQATDPNFDLIPGSNEVSKA